jgi:hypothetical protein
MKKGHNTVVFWIFFVSAWFFYESRASTIVANEANLLDRQYQAKAILYVGRTQCADGWVSDSYGGGGTCSSHGGVTTSNGTLHSVVNLDAEKITSARLNSLRFWVACFLLLAYFISPFIQGLFDVPPVSKVLTPKPAPLQVSTSVLIPQTKTTNCPVCGGTMVKRMAKKGRTKGQYFWGCGRYPKCTGTRPAN